MHFQNDRQWRWLSMEKRLILTLCYRLSLPGSASCCWWLACCPLHQSHLSWIPNAVGAVWQAEVGYATSELFIIESTFSLWMLVKGKLECSWYMHMICILILNVFIAISTITMNGRGNRGWLTSDKLCCNLFKKFKFKMRQSKCCWLIKGARQRGMSLSIASQWVRMETLPLSSDLPWWLFCCLSYSWLRLQVCIWKICDAEAPLLLCDTLPLSFAQSVVFDLEGLCGAGGRSIRSVPPNRASEEPQRMKSSLVIYEIRISPGTMWLWSRVAGQEEAKRFEA